MQKKLPHNPIMQDTKKGALRYYTYGASFFNYGMLPQTWEDPSKSNAAGFKGDNDPLDVMEIGSRPFAVGEMRPVKVLGDLELIDQGELDHKDLVINAADQLSCPVLLLQGDEDKVVPPNQAETMFAALKAKGIATALKMYEGEQHGFRKAENIEDALNSEVCNTVNPKSRSECVTLSNPESRI